MLLIFGDAGMEVPGMRWNEGRKWARWGDWGTRSSPARDHVLRFNHWEVHTLLITISLKVFSCFSFRQDCL